MMQCHKLGRQFSAAELPFDAHVLVNSYADGCGKSRETNCAVRDYENSNLTTTGLVRRVIVKHTSARTLSLRCRRKISGRSA